MHWARKKVSNLLVIEKTEVQKMVSSSYTIHIYDCFYEMLCYIMKADHLIYLLNYQKANFVF